MIPKQSLTGYNSERVDTRVLQVLYELPDDRKMDVFVGQQMDVYLKVMPTSKSASIDFGGLDAQLPFEDKKPLAPAPSKPGADRATRRNPRTTQKQERCWSWF